MSLRNSLALAVALGVSLSAQTFRTTSNVIAVEATVVDKSGKPVTDLTAADFQILEDGKPQPVQTIYLVTAPSTSSGSRTAPPGAPGTGAPEHPPTSAPGAPGSPTVRVEVRNRVFVFVFDLAHLSADGYKRSRSAVESFLKDGALPTDMIGILSGGTMLNNKIDSDKAALLKAMDSMKGPNQARYNDLRAWPRLIDDAEALAVARGNEGTINAVVLRACGERPEECNSGKGGNEVVRQQVEAKGREFASQSHRDAQLSLAAMATLANGLGRFPGRKQVVLFSDGFLTTELESQLKAVVEIAAKNNVRFSTLDSRGLNRDPRSQNFMNDQPLTAAGDMSPVTFDSNSDAMSSIAIDTGGEFLMNRNDLRPALDIVATMSGNFYVLGYSPEKPMDGSYRKIDVKVTRPGLTVRARRGYVATSTPVAPSTPAPGPAPADLPISNPAIPIPEIVNPTILNSGAGDPPTVADATPKVRPNSGRNVDALTKIAPSGGASEAQKLANAGWDAYSKGDVVTARETLNKAVATGPTSPWVSYALGFSEYATGHYEAALKAWDTVRVRVPEFMPVYFDIADANLSLGRSADALAILRDTARRWPLEPEAQNALGTLLVRRGAFDDAIDVFTKITTAKPADSLGFFNLGRAYHLRYLRLQQNIAASRLGDKSAIGEEDRKKAIAAYKQYLSLGGPFEKEAKEAIALLDWK
ncbi:MAG: VWA domain-containing protein [Acidobacteria bacterium]|nr:MAG: VWA domain-containing protein [Acidobacteriota bacterium]